MWKKRNELHNEDFSHLAKCERTKKKSERKEKSAFTVYFDKIIYLRLNNQINFNLKMLPLAIQFERILSGLNES